MHVVWKEMSSDGLKYGKGATGEQRHSRQRQQKPAVAEKSFDQPTIVG